MARKIKLNVEYDETQEILQVLTDTRIYDPHLLYRVFTREPGFDIKTILRNGTDRTENFFRESSNISEALDSRREERGRPLRQSEYIWATTEEGLSDEIQQARTKISKEETYVSVYDRSKMFCLDDNVCFEFRDQRRKGEALVALIHLHYQ